MRQKFREAAPEGSPLENIANKESAVDSPGDSRGAAGPVVDRRKRADRYERRAFLWGASALPRLRNCGRAPWAEVIWLRFRDGVAGWHGLQHCGSVWSCPVCSSRIRFTRSREVAAVLARAVEDGHPLGFVTLTMRHHRGQSLIDLWDAAAAAWRRASQGRQWRRVVGSVVTGVVRVWEVTYGANGWHVHVHAVVVMEPGQAGAFDGVAAGMYERWSAGLQAAGLDAPLLRGQDWHVVEGEAGHIELAWYVLKVSEPEVVGRALGFELGYSMSGRAQSVLATRTPFHLLDEVRLLGDADSFDAWLEYESGSRGRRQIGWSKALRERFGVAPDDRTDEEIAREEVGTEADNEVGMTADRSWRVFIEHAYRQWALLDLREESGLDAVLDALRLWGIPFVLSPTLDGTQAATDVYSGFDG